MKMRGSFARLFSTILFFHAASFFLYAAPPGTVGRPERSGDRLVCRFQDYAYALNLKNLSCMLLDSEGKIDTIISGPAFPSSGYRINDELTMLSYPGRGLEVSIGFEDGSLVLGIASRKPQPVTWPSIEMKKEGTALIWPHFEGNYIPLTDRTWLDFLTSQTWNTTQDQYLPFWGIEGGKRLLSYLVENPFHNDIVFKEKSASVRMDFTHTFTDNADLSKPITFRVYRDRDVTPITPAKHFRRFLQERNVLVSLQDKMKVAPAVSRLIGAPHAYIWDGSPITIADIEPDGWVPLAKAIVEQASSGRPTAGKRIVAASEREVFESMSRAATVQPYLMRAMAGSLSEAARSPVLYSDEVWPLASLPSALKKTAQRILGGEEVSVSDGVQLNSWLLHASFPVFTTEPSTWGNGVSTRMIDALERSGMKRFLLTCDGIGSIESRPYIATYAAEKGYVIGPYDGYDSVHESAAAEWSTAVFDRALYETGRIIRADGKPVRGFNGVGYAVSPIAVKPYLEERVAKNFRTVPQSYYFLDGEAFGTFLDDYHPGRKVCESEDAAARVDNVRSVFEKYRVPIGSEGGSYLFAPVLSVAEGVFFPTLGKRGDPDMELNEMSNYFLGRPFPADESEQFFLPVELKEKYVRLYSDPRFRLPLYEAVLHDCVITTSHYASPSLKFANIAGTTALTEILYQVAPMYHFNLTYFEKIKATIAPQVEVFEKTHPYSYRYALEDFAFLTEDRKVQKTRFGNLELIANFREADFDYPGTTIPAKSLFVSFADSGQSFIYHPSTPSVNPVHSKDIPALIADLKDDDWEVRAAAAKALANTEGKAAAAVPALMLSLKDEEWQVRRPAAYALASLGAKAKAAAPLLIEALNDEEWHVRRAAATALGSIGADKTAGIAALKARLADPELQVRLAAQEALRSMGQRHR